jgi:hypothetical protein
MEFQHDEGGNRRRYHNVCDMCDDRRARAGANKARYVFLLMRV